MSIHTADAIVLRLYPYRETSAFVSCLTDRFGKVKGMIKGLRDRSRPRYRSAMEPMTWNRIVFYDTRSSPIHLITQCDLLNGFDGLARDLESIRVAATCIELTDVVVEPDEPQPQIFELLKATLQRLSSGDTRLGSIRIHFVLRLLKLAGFHPQLDACAHCNRGLIGHAASWSSKQGGLLCDDCLHEDPRAERMGSELIDVLAACAATDEPLEVASPTAIVLLPRLHEFLHWRLDRPLRTLRAPVAVP